MGYLYAIWAAYLEQFKVGTRLSNVVVPLLSGIAPAAVLAWIGSQSDNRGAVASLSVGIFFMVVWMWGVFWVGWSLTWEFQAGTLDFSFASRTPIALIALGKALGAITCTIPAAIICLLTALFVFRRWPDVADLPLALLSLGLTLLVLVAVTLIFAPLMLLSRGRGGFFNALQPIGVLLSGFLYPISLLPAWMQVLAWLMPTSWAMDSTMRAIEGNAAGWTIARDWALALTLAVVYVAAAFFLLKKVEERIRMAGDSSAV